MSDYPDLETMARQLWDIEQIKQLKYRNLRFLDQKRWDDMAETFAEDVSTSWVNGTLRLEGRKAVMDFLRGTDFAKGDLVITTHQASTPEIEITGEGTATGIWRLYNPMSNRRRQNSYRLLSFYHDTYQRIGGAWKIRTSGHEYLHEEVFDWKDVPSRRELYRHPF